MWDNYEQPYDWDTFSIKEKLDHIVKRLSFVSTRGVYKEFRQRYISEQQYEEEFGPNSGFNELMHQLWFSAKEDYYRHKDMYDTYLECNPQSQSYMNNIEAMRKVVDEEVETMLLEDLAESNNDENNDDLTKENA